MARSFEGKRGLVMGVANKRSIAWAIAQQLADGGASLAFTYQGERIEKSVRDLAEDARDILVRADVAFDDERAGDRVGELPDALLDPLALEGERDLRALVGEPTRDRPRDRALVRNAEDETALAFEHAATLSGAASGPGR